MATQTTQSIGHRGLTIERLKPLIFLLLLGPALSIAWRTWSNHLGANPVETLLHLTGLWALRMLLLCLAMTPLQRFFRWLWPIRLRRMIGLYAFFYALAHFCIYAIFDRELDFSSILGDVIKRPYITLGFLSLMILLPLAITSTQGWIRRLGPGWKRLHRGVYFAGILSALHFIWLVKADIREPLIYAMLLSLLLLARLPTKYVAKLRRS